jgi:hypothetical protein
LAPAMLKSGQRIHNFTLQNPVYHDRGKHIKVPYHYIRQCVDKENVIVKFTRMIEVSRRYSDKASQPRPIPGAAWEYRNRQNKVLPPIRNNCWGHSINFILS